MVQTNDERQGDKYMKCPECDSNMVKQYGGVVLLTCPPKYGYDWYCGCGHKEDGGLEEGFTPKTTHELWEEANK